MNIELNYKDYSIEDFVWDPVFRQWVLNPDAEMDIFWNEWLIDNPQKQEMVLTAKQIIRAIKVKDKPVYENEVKLAVQSILEEIDRPAAKKRSRFNIRHYLIAASVLLVSCLTAWFVLNDRHNGSDVTYTDLVRLSEEHLVERVNTTSAPVHISLADGSKIILGRNARLSFPASFLNHSKRKVYLNGEAFFEVAKDPSRPFLVYANGLITKVLGTKFKIRAYDNEQNATVEVTSGIVSVFSFIDKMEQNEDKSKKLNSLILTRNQKANYSSQDKTLMAAIVDDPQEAAGYNPGYNFSEVPLPRVFRLITQGYGIDIVFDKTLSKRTFSGNLESTSLYQKMDIICKVLNARYETIDGKIVIYTAHE